MACCNSKSVNTSANLCYNPGFQVWQANHVVQSMPHRTPLAVGLLYGKGGTPVSVKGERSSDTPDNSVPYSAKLTVISGAKDLASDTENHLRWAVHGRKLRPFVTSQIALKFCVKSSLPGIYCITAINELRDTHFVREYTINSADVWEEKEVLFPFGSKPGVWNIDDGFGVGFRFCLASAHGMQSVKDQWCHGNKSGTSSQVNWLGNEGSTFYLAKLRIHAGSVPDFHLPDISKVEDEAQREHRTVGCEVGGVNVAVGYAVSQTECNFDVLLDRKMSRPPVISCVGALNADIVLQEVNSTVERQVSALTSHPRSKDYAKFGVSAFGLVSGNPYYLRLKTPNGKLVFDGHLG